MDMMIGDFMMQLAEVNICLMNSLHDLHQIRPWPKKDKLLDIVLEFAVPTMYQKTVIFMALTLQSTPHLTDYHHILQETWIGQGYSLQMPVMMKIRSSQMDPSSNHHMETTKSSTWCRMDEVIKFIRAMMMASSASCITSHHKP